MATDTRQLEADTSDRDKAKAAQQARAKKYHIAVKDGGNVTKPGEWASLDDSAFGDPVNYRYPMADKCLIGETEIALSPGGATVPIRNLCGRTVPIFTYDSECGKIRPALATDIHCTLRNAPVFRVLFDNGQSVTCTANHPFLLRDGTYVQVSDLRPGAILMSLDIMSAIGYNDEYDRSLRKYQSLAQASGRCASGYAGGRSPQVEGSAPRDRQGNTAALSGWTSRRGPGQGCRTAATEEGCRSRRSKETPRSLYSPTKGQAGRDCWKTQTRDLRDLRIERIQDCLGSLSRDNDLPRVDLRSLQQSARVSLRLSRTSLETSGLPLAVGSSYRVLSIEPAGKADVYDLTVEGTHNFALAAGVFVHNSHADNAASRWGDTSNRSQYSSAEQKLIGDRITARQRHFGTKAAKDDGDKQESASIIGSPSGSSSSTHPRERIATLQVRWISDGARSVNGRVYPAETVSRLIASGQRKVADPNGLPITCFLSHADADSDHTPSLIGKATRIWREGADGMALLDLADTSHAKDALGLIAGGYIRTESLRASNAELRTDPRYDVPVVAGDRIELDGIDLTNYPGLEAVARIQRVHIAESAPDQSLTEVFAIAPTALEIQQPAQQQKGQFMSKIHEAGGDNTVNGYAPTSGNTVGMTNDPPQDSYGQRMYQQPAMTSGMMQGMDHPAYAVDLREAHDRIAMVQGRSCAPAKESARGQAVLASMTETERASLTEAGRPLSAKNDAHLDRAHDALAHHMQMACEGMNNKPASAPSPSAQANDGMQDGDDDDKTAESRKKGTVPAMTREEQLAEARKLLETEGYSGITPPPTPEQQLRESLLSDLRKEFAAQLTAQQPRAATPEPAPQRKSMVEGTADKGGAKPYRPGQYLRERINNMDWQGLTDRTRPLPADLDLKFLIKEFEQLYAVQYDNRFQVLSATELR